MTLRKILTILVVALSLGEVIPARALQAAEPRSLLAHAEIQRNLTYATVEGKALRLDFYPPQETDGPAPCLVYIHGGAWQQGSKRWVPLKWLTRHGYAVASIEYRLSQVAKFPAQIHDCKGAVRWLRANADSLGIDPDRLAAGGHSAGGHLAALLGASGDVGELEGDVGGNLEQSSRVAAVVDYFGPADLVRMVDFGPPGIVAFHNQQRSPIYRLLGGALSDKQAEARSASPTCYISDDDPPLLIFHGDQDDIVPVQQSKLFAEAYRNGGLPVTLQVIPDAGHGWASTPEQDAKVLEFLDQALAR